MVLEPKHRGGTAVEVDGVHGAVALHDLDEILVLGAHTDDLAAVDDEQQHRAVGALADRRARIEADIQRIGAGGDAVDDQHRSVADRVADVVVDDLLPRHGPRHMQDVVAVDGRDPAAAFDAAAVFGIIDLAVDHDERVGDAAVAHPAGIVKAAGVRAGHAVKILHVFGDDIPLLAVGRGDAAHDDARRVDHDHHIAGIALALDRLDDDAVAVLIGVKNAVNVCPARSVFRYGGIGADRNERGVRRREVHRLLDRFDLSDLFRREIDVCKEFDGAGLAHGGDEEIARRLRRAFGQHIHDAVQRQTDQQQRFQQQKKNAPDHAKRAAGPLLFFRHAFPVSFFSGLAHVRFSFGVKPECVKIKETVFLDV